MRKFLDGVYAVVVFLFLVFFMVFFFASIARVSGSHLLGLASLAIAAVATGVAGKMREDVACGLAAIAALLVMFLVVCSIILSTEWVGEAVYWLFGLFGCLFAAIGGSSWLVVNKIPVIANQLGLRPRQVGAALFIEGAGLFIACVLPLAGASIWWSGCLGLVTCLILDVWRIMTPG